MTKKEIKKKSKLYIERLGKEPKADMRWQHDFGNWNADEWVITNWAEQEKLKSKLSMEKSQREGSHCMLRTLKISGIRRTRHLWRSRWGKKKQEGWLKVYIRSIRLRDPSFVHDHATICPPPRKGWFPPWWGGSRGTWHEDTTHSWMWGAVLKTGELSGIYKSMVR